MANNSIKNKILAISPYIEVLVRNIYWKNINFFKRIKIKSGTKKVDIKKVSFENICNVLVEFGVKPDSLIVIHSAFASLKPTGLKPIEIIDKIIELIGINGTLAMPAMPKFINDLDGDDYINKNVDDLVFDYNVNTTPIKTGVLPTVLFSKEGSIRSDYPINTMVAYGKLAEQMMAKNFTELNPLPCGKGSTWDFCYQNNAIIVGLGVDLTHSLTMIHVAEDLLDSNWPIANWYRKKRFKITKDDVVKVVNLRERKPKWGTLHFAERTLCKDLIKNGIMKSTIVDGVLIEVIKSNELINYLNSKNKNGYPYFGIKQYIHRKNNSKS
jgi:aminoglycoside 3-N-acetyltransferase